MAPLTRSPRRRAFWAGVALAAMAAVTYVSSLSQPDLPPGPWAWSDKLTHAGVWSVIGACWALAGARPGRRAALVAFAIATAFGGFDELHQSTTPGRDASWLDLLADAVGAAAGAFALTWYSASQWPPAAPPSSASATSTPASPTTSSSPITSR